MSFLGLGRGGFDVLFVVGLLHGGARGVGKDRVIRFPEFLRIQRSSHGRGARGSRSGKKAVTKFGKKAVSINIVHHSPSLLLLLIKK